MVGLRPGARSRMGGRAEVTGAGWGDGSGPRQWEQAEGSGQGPAPAQRALPAAGSVLWAEAGRPAWQGRAATRRPRERLELRGDWHRQR